MNYKLRELLE